MSSTAFRELIGSHPGNLATVLKGVVNNELGQFRTPSNMALISMMIHSWPEEAAKVCKKMCVYPGPTYMYVGCIFCQIRQFENYRGPLMDTVCYLAGGLFLLVSDTFWRDLLLTHHTCISYVYNYM